MGYKRKARIVFLAESVQLADMAAELGNKLGRAWLECRTVPLAHPSSDLLQWADLIITLDEVAQQNHPKLLHTAQQRHCPCPNMADAHDCLATHIQSLLGGMRILNGGYPPKIRQ